MSDPAISAAPPPRWAWPVSLAAAAVVALVVASPVLRFVSWAGPAYDGVTFLGASDGEQYLNQFQQSLRGGFGTPNDIVWEYGREGGGPGPWIYRAIVLPYRLIGGDLHVYNAVLTAVCAAIQCLLLERIARRLGASRAGAVAAALACCLVPNLWAFHGWERWLFAPDRAQIDFLALYRPMNPSFSSLFLWTPLLALLAWIERPRLATWLVVAAAAALSYDVYPPLFTVYGGLLAGAAVVLLARRRWRDGGLLAAAGVLGLACSLPKLGWVFGAAEGVTNGGDAQNAAEGNVNAIRFSSPIVTGNVATLLALAAVALVVHWRSKLTDKALTIAVAAPVAILAIYNQHLVTGRIYQPFHYDWFYTAAFLWLGLAALLPQAAEPLSRLGRWCLAEGRWRRITIGAVALSALAVVAAAMPGLTGRALHALGVLRAERLLRPGLFAFLGVVVPAAVWASLRLAGTGRVRIVGLGLAVLVGAAALVEGWRIQDHAYRRRREEHLGFQRIAPALRWVETNAEPEAVVACANGSLPRLFTSYTGRNVYVSLEVIFYGAPSEEEYLERRLLWLALYGVTRDELAAELGDRGRFHYDIFKWRTFGPPPPKLAFLSYGENPNPLGPDAIPTVLAKYDRVLSMTPAERLAKYRLDYVLWSDLDPKPVFRDPATLGYPLDVAFDAPGCRLYRVRR